MLLLWRLIIALTNIINLYLGSDKQDELRTVLSSPDAKVKATINQYIYEGLSQLPFYFFQVVHWR